MKSKPVEETYEKYYSGKHSRQGVFRAMEKWMKPQSVLYPGGFIHITASFFFPFVTYVDTDHQAKRFFAQKEEVLSLINRHKIYTEPADLKFHGCSYEDDWGEKKQFDLLISLYAGFISQPCQRYLSIGGILLVNNSHADAGLAALNPDYEFMGVLKGQDDRLHLVEGEAESYFQPKKEMLINEEVLRKRGRGIAYTKTAPAYLFRRIR